MKKIPVFAVATRHEAGKFAAVAQEIILDAEATPKFSRGSTREEALGKALRKGRIYYSDLVTEKYLLVAESREQTILLEVRGEYVNLANP